MTFAGDDRTIPSRGGMGDETLPVRPGGGTPGGGGPGGGRGGGDEERRKLPWIIAGVLALGLLIGAIVAVVASGDDKGKDRPRRTTTTSSSTSTSTSAPTTTTSPANPQITQFGYNPASPDCPSNIQVSWSTQNATKVSISIDGPGPYETDLPPNGSLQVPFAENNMDPPECSHTYLLTAFGANNQQDTQQIEVSEST